MTSQRADKVTDETIKLFTRLRLPRAITLDLGSSFKSYLLPKFESDLGVKPCFSTPYHHQSLSSAERYVGTLKNMLCKFVPEDPRSFDKKIDLLIFEYSEVPCVTTGFSPFQLMSGRTARGPLQVWKEELTQQAVSVSCYISSRLEGEIEAVFRTCNRTVMSFQVKMKTYYDKNSR